MACCSGLLTCFGGSKVPKKKAKPIDAANVFEEVFQRACSESADAITRDELPIALGLLEAQPELGSMVADMLRNADSNRDGVLTRAEWDRYVGYLHYNDDLKVKLAATVTKADLGSVGQRVADARAKLPEGWTRTAQGQGICVYENKRIGIRVATLGEALEASQAKQVKKLPPGFKIMPSRSRPGEQVYHDPTTNTTFASFDEAWRFYEAQQQQLQQVPADRQMQLTKALSKGMSRIGLDAKGGGAQKGAPKSVRKSAQGLPSVLKAPAAPAGRASAPKGSQKVGSFVDGAFQPNEQSLGTPKPGRSFISNEQRANTRWIRLPELMKLNGDVEAVEDVLLWDEIEPTCLTQGALGDCWLISSIAALAEFPEAVKALFVTQEVSLDGKYTLRLFDMGKSRWEEVVVDDYVPCSLQEDYSNIPVHFNEKGQKYYKAADVKNPDGSSKVPKKWTPHFAKTCGQQIWPLLVEKSVAKFVGSYARMAGGSEAYALMALTGFPIVYCFMRPSVDASETAAVLGSWDWCGAQYISRDNPATDFEKVQGVNASLSDEQMWEKLSEYDSLNYLLTASITRFAKPRTQQENIRPDGLVVGHAYSLVSCRAVRLNYSFMGLAKSDVLLMCLRNPHGTGDAQESGVVSTEWNGDWSDSSPLWDKHPEVARQVGFEAVNDGLFWMSWKDFSRVFDKTFVLARSQSEPRSQMAFQRRMDRRADMCMGLKAMANTDEAIQKDLKQLTCVFDPFSQIPDFVDDGTRDTRLRWDATKPGRLQGWLDLNIQSGNQSGHDQILAKIKELGLEAALGPEGCI